MAGRTAASWDGFCVRRIVLLAPDERFDIDRRNQPNFMAESADGASPVMGAPAGLHRNDAAWVLSKKSEDFIARKCLAERHAAVSARPMRLKAPLCKVETDDANFSMDALFIRGMRKHRHLGTSRCRQEGASTPSNQGWRTLRAAVSIPPKRSRPLELAPLLGARP